EDALPAGAGRLAHDPQLPHAALLGAQRFRPRPAAAPERHDLGGRVPLHGEPDQAEARPVPPARQARAVRAPRPAPLPDPARLVEGLYLDLRATAGRGSRDRALALELAGEMGEQPLGQDLGLFLREEVAAVGDRAAADV